MSDTDSPTDRGLAPPTIAVTGATGNIGGRVARLLAGQGLTQRLIARRPDAVPPLAGADLAQASFDDSAALTRAFSGINTLFFVSATEAPDRVRWHRNVVDAAVSAGVERVVYLSFFGAAPDAVFTFARDHYDTEQYLKESGLVYTFLQDNLYADFLPSMAGQDGVIRGPAGDGLFAPVAQRDVAEVAAAVLTDDGGAHTNATYRLTGPELLSMADVAHIITDASGQRTTYHPETETEAFESRAVFNAPDWEVAAWVSNYMAIAAGELAPVTDGVSSVVGRPATSLAELLRS